MKGTLCGAGVRRRKAPGRHRGGCRMMPVTRLSATGKAVEAGATTGGTEWEG